MLGIHSDHSWSVPGWKVLFCSEQCTASFAAGNGLLWVGRGRKRFSFPTSFKLSSRRSTFYSTCHRDLHQIRWSDDTDLWHRSRWRGQSSNCGGTSGEKVQKPIIRVYLSTTCRCLLWRQAMFNLAPRHRSYGSMFNPMADLHNETGNHQDQVKVLIEKTASSLDDTALKLLFVSVQRNNIDLCVRYAINLYVMFSYCLWVSTMTFFRLTDKIGVCNTVCCRHRNSNDCKAEFNSGGFDKAYTDMVWAFICECKLHSLN